MPSKQAAKQQYATMAAAKRDIKALFEAASRGDTKTVEGTVSYTHLTLPTKRIV